MFLNSFPAVPATLQRPRRETIRRKYPRFSYIATEMAPRIIATPRGAVSSCSFEEKSNRCGKLPRAEKANERRGGRLLSGFFFHPRVDNGCITTKDAAAATLRSRRQRPR